MRLTGCLIMIDGMMWASRVMSQGSLVRYLENSWRMSYDVTYCPRTVSLKREAASSRERPSKSWMVSRPLDSA